MILTTLKRKIPEAVKKPLRKVKIGTIVNKYRKRKLARVMRNKHEGWIRELRSKRTVKVVFLAIHESVWKVDAVFRKMLTDPYFEPEILVCPYVAYGDERMLQDMDQAYLYFESLGYPVAKSIGENGEWLALDTFAPDIIFFTNPHNLTRPEYYNEAYLNYLSCYVPYFYLVTTHGGDLSIYDQELHNALWRYYLPHKTSLEDCKKTISGGCSAIRLVGYPAAEDLLSKRFGTEVKGVWKGQSKVKKKIIWAPHHTIESQGFQLSNFLSYAKEFVRLADVYSDEVQWAFKPHPMLKSKLNLHSDWGKEVTNDYYEFWANSPNTQLELGEYGDLFSESDAMIHDSGSFLAEYLLLRKPVMYLLKDRQERIYFNKFGQLALDACTHGCSIQDIEDFVDSICAGDSQDIYEGIDRFLENQILPFSRPSQAIVDDIKISIQE